MCDWLIMDIDEFYLSISMVNNPNTYITGFEEFSVILPEIHWKCTKSQSASHVDVMFFLD